MAIMLASMQIRSPPFFAFKHSACQLGTVAVCEPFPKPSDVSSNLKDQGGGANNGDNATDDELVPRMLYAIFRGLKGTQQDLIRTPGIKVI